MGKYNSYNRSYDRREREARNRAHPIWRGVGFGLMVLIPFLSYFGALLLLQENAANGWFSIPVDYLAKTGDPLLYVKIGLTVLLAILVYIVVSFLGVLVLRAFGRSRYGPLDAEEIKYKR